MICGLTTAAFEKDSALRWQFEIYEDADISAAVARIGASDSGDPADLIAFTFLLPST